MEFIHLPDDVLVMVLQFVSVSDLLTCRLVCKRLGSLALHHDSWCLRKIGGESGPACVCAVLQLAPCVDTLTFSSGVHTAAFTFTSCAARTLHLIAVKPVHEGGPCLAEYALVLRNQQALGRLRNVHVATRMSTKCTYTIADTLLRAILVCTDLHSIIVDCPASPRLILRKSLVLPPLYRPSLRYFQCGLERLMDNFVATVLSRHSDTLEEVVISQIKPYREDGIFNSITLLSKLPNLCKLSTGMFRGVEMALAGCTALTHLHVVVDHESITRSAELLRRTTRQLRKLHILITEQKCATYNMDAEADIFKGMSFPVLENLTLSNFRNMPALVSVLHQLPALSHLLLLLNIAGDRAVDAITTVNVLLEGVTPSRAPNLRALTVMDFASGSRRVFRFGF